MKIILTESQLSEIKTLQEGFSDIGTPDMKYYAFDWDDNIMRMPTEIVVMDENGNEVGMSTEDFAEYRVKIGNEPFNYRGKTIVGLAKDAFRNFTTKGDKKFISDSQRAELGPAWSDFVEALNGGSIFSIITARGHTPIGVHHERLGLLVAALLVDHRSVVVLELRDECLVGLIFQFESIHQKQHAPGIAGAQ